MVSSTLSWASANATLGCITNEVSTAPSFSATEMASANVSRLVGKPPTMTSCTPARLPRPFGPLVVVPGAVLKKASSTRLAMSLASA